MAKTLTPYHRQYVDKMLFVLQMLITVHFQDKYYNTIQYNTCTYNTRVVNRQDRIWGTGSRLAKIIGVSIEGARRGYGHLEFGLAPAWAPQ